NKGQSDDVLQKSQSVHSSITQQIKSLDPTSQQEAFQQKYQLVEVLNSEGEWISGYSVHVCIVVANLAGIERKYALVDERGAKYAFLGQIRLPRIE
ncbi:MAG: hypothetical protein HC820_07090, partial [Hydrococcus sp. RM1_1_31]|nr:hypothetical protein [Hydrococcus sp. RM1_1_31]